MIDLVIIVGLVLHLINKYFDWQNKKYANEILKLKIKKIKHKHFYIA
ncbi:hypothetical protein [Lactobacillus mulieris]|uniref:Uncharacterized protein n=1 Tax=Lactobacillus mulieris TaxID=2508708 RepID=A0AAW5WWN9_9LACO|nr:hypothetical protein [Lactobacillus mulieris]MCZ3621399.1 hypothetical protein [Lactobacillus mulieris]MCZ3623325.1 hypothetical protein [Lactobacillus mulieris]MCZ3635406.1 hypothetical protein [Lactobacillus mulieris]MCZ3689486.1 hypothetical protein [Lactobacillus mulieris]MCZ3695489.1 hypothetical protein [Lactobacillus mulieris]